MGKKIMQFRYYGDGASNNQPKEDIDKISLLTGRIFEECLPITQLGIQTLPGIRVYLNNNIENPVIIGSTGIYELNLEGISEITNIYFDSQSLSLIEDNSNAYLIIDVIGNV